MKISLLFVLWLSVILSYGQKKIEVKSSSEKFSTGTVDALVVNIYEADVKFVKKSWKKLLKGYNGKIKMGSEIFADNALIKDLSSNTVDIYSKINEKKDGIVEIVCAMDLGGVFLSESSNSDKYKVFKKIFKSFAINVSKDAVKEKIDEQEKILKQLSKNKENLISDKEKLSKEIEKYKQKIADNEKAIEQNIKDQAEKTKEIESQKKVVSDLNDKKRAIN